MNEHTPVRVGFAMTGSFCTFSQVIDQMEQMAQQTGWQLYPILSPNAYETDTRFGSAQQFRRRIEEICGREIWHTLTQTEPIGPKSCWMCCWSHPAPATPWASWQTASPTPASPLPSKRTCETHVRWCWRYLPTMPLPTQGKTSAHCSTAKISTLFRCGRMHPSKNPARLSLTLAA